MRKLILPSLILFSPFISRCLELSNKFDLILAPSYTKQAQSTLNPGNQILQRPRTTLISEVRADFKIMINKKWFFIARPQWVLTHQQIYTESPDSKKTELFGKLDLSDFFTDYQINESLNVAIGLQNYQWGPAELLSPSNPIFHFQSQQKSFLHKEKGKVLAKLNWDPSQDWNLLLLNEFLSNNEPEFIADEDFKNKSLFRIENKLSNPFNYWGLTIGTEQNQDLFVGAYGNWTFYETLSFYVDSKHRKGRYHYRPEQNFLGLYDLTLAPREKESIFNLSVLGLRYEEDIDLRLEYVNNQIGFNKSELKNAITSASTLSPNLVQNLKRFQNTGLEFLGQNYLYISLRKNNVLKFMFKDLIFSTRYLHSMQDSSGVLQMVFEKPIFVSATGYLESQLSLGEDAKEFTLADRSRVALGFQFPF